MVTNSATSATVDMVRHAPDKGGRTLRDYSQSSIISSIMKPCVAVSIDLEGRRCHEASRSCGGGTLPRRPASRAERVIHMISQPRTVAASLLVDDDRPAALDVRHPN